MATYATYDNMAGAVTTDSLWGNVTNLTSYITNPGAINMIWSDENIRTSIEYTITNTFPITVGSNETFAAGTPYITGWDSGVGVGQETTGITGVIQGTSIYNPYNVVTNSTYITNNPILFINNNEDLQEYLQNTKRYEKRQKIRSGMIIHIKNRADPATVMDTREQTALDTLREMVTEEEFRRYLRYGFVMVKGRSGDRYQVYRNKSHTKVWRGGKVIEEVCVRIKSDIGAPPTDNVVAFKVAIEADEASFKAMGNLYRMAA